MGATATELTALSIAEARLLLDRREVSATELTAAHLDRIAAVEGRVHAFLHVMDAVARAQAAEADRRILSGDAAWLTGIPIALKDVLVTTDAPTTAASKILAGFVAPYDATVVDRLRTQGAVFVGKANTDEFAMGSSTENSAYGPTRNPWDLGAVPGGSSGGPAAAVAAREAMGGLGSDTGGSIRQPAGFCGTVGLKPTYGRVSRYGLIAFGSSLDCIGPFARTVEDAAILLGAIAGHDPLDSTSLPDPVPDYRAALRATDLRGVRLGVPAEYFIAGMDPDVEAAVRHAISELEHLGAQLLPISLPYTQYGLATYYIVAPAEVSANLARFDGVKYGYSHQAGDLRDSYELTRSEGFGPEVKRRIMLGTYALSSGYYDAYYVKAQKTRTLVKRDFDTAFAQVDAIVTPTSPSVAFRFGEKSDDPVAMYLCDVFTIPASMAGIPGLSITCGFKGDLPIALQILGPALGEEICLRVAHAYEQASPWRRRSPALTGD